MSEHRLLVELLLQAGSVIELEGPRAHYLITVLRARAGDQVTLFDGTGIEHPCTVQRVLAKTATLRVGKPIEPPTHSPVRTWLIQGIARGERMDYCVQKATELGVHRIYPVFTERSGVKLDAERASKRRDHWQKIAVSASEQSGRAIVPVIGTPRTLDYFLARDFPVPSISLLMDPVEGLDSLGEIEFEQPHPVLLFVGPEGGFNQSETTLLREKCTASLKLGNRVLRSETAGIIGLTTIQLYWGDF